MKSIDAEYVIVFWREALLSQIYEVSFGSVADSGAQATVLVNKFYKKNSLSDIKVVLDRRVMYFSRSDTIF